ncbi:MAG TPA: cytochrome c oxidase subunit II [Alphaproteobacteria bacterium]|jgi:cytochrome c oxidase subunit 2|nr:cytochrome c oxidase subunit II [Alphaproteobacteria bacterium]HIA20980.1 cytochrome c oxidase subunit II [Alphaproteobacteria bacterium]HIB18708.1 cytochrome c oxidase subunit II [Alphaproteobacteria bacterium]HIB55784.1 cytochrome c oxidase subunit II [Alphaproteobacteria bacterium]HIN93613.1 cytochrome c oxidase subunit II [Alphaproteobacteria bacterium]
MLARNILTGATALVTSVVVSVTEVLANPQTGQPAEWQLGFQRAVTPVMESINTLHNYVLILITLISLFILALLIFVAVRFNAKSNPNPSQVTHNTVIEVLWTAVPILILVVMAIPSFKLLYLQDTFPEHVDLNIKATAYQWFWTYEYPDEGFEFDAFKLEAEEAEEVGEPYLLAVDTKVVVPVGKVVRVQVTSADVIHAWAVPALGVKMDAYPGRLNELWFQVNEPGVYYGQCSELCGQGHAFMPIAVEAMLEAEYEVWLNEAREEYARIGENIRVADSNLSVAK